MFGGLKVARRTLILLLALGSFAFAPIGASAGTPLSAADLGTLGGDSSWASALDDTGEVVGMSVTASGENHPFYWTQKGGMIDLGTLGGTYSAATDVSDGRVVGYSTTATGELHAFLWTTATGIVDLGTFPGGAFSIARGINEAGQVVGYSSGSSFGLHAFVWTPYTGMVDLGTLAGPYGASFAYAINDAGQVVGCSTNDTYDTHAFSWTPENGMVDLGALGGPYSCAYGVNAHGAIVGETGPSTTITGRQAFIWKPDVGMLELGMLEGTRSFAADVNNENQIVGYVELSSGVLRPFLWSETYGMAVLDSEPGPDSIAQSINNLGLVAGMRFSHAALWRLDSTAPTVSVTGVTDHATYELESVPRPGCATIDDGSGVATEASVEVAGGTSNGVGTFAVTCSGARDNAGNQAPPVSVTYRVVYSGVSGILQPINPDNTSIFRRGKTIPVKFRLGSDPPAGFDTTTWTIQAQAISSSAFSDSGGTLEDVASVTPSTNFRYDSTADEYVYNADMQTSSANTYWRFKITLDSGQSFYSAVIELK